MNVYIVLYDILMNIIIVYLTKGGAVDPITPGEAVMVFCVHNAIATWLVSLDLNKTNVRRFIFHIRATDTVIIYTSIKLLAVALLVVEI